MHMHRHIHTLAKKPCGYSINLVLENACMKPHMHEGTGQSKQYMCTTRKRHRHTQTHTHPHTHRETDIHEDKQTHIGTDTQEHIHTQRDIHTWRHTDRLRHRHALSLFLDKKEGTQHIRTKHDNHVRIQWNTSEGLIHIENQARNIHTRNETKSDNPPETVFHTSEACKAVHSKCGYHVSMKSHASAYVYGHSNIQQYVNACSLWIWACPASGLITHEYSLSRETTGKYARINHEVIQAKRLNLERREEKQPEGCIF
jgi:hypothetical protein